MDSINESKLVDSKVTSRYTIVLAAAKRARQIIDGANPLTYAPTDRAVSIAVKEMSEGKLMIKVEEDMLDGNYERKLKNQYRYRNIAAVSRDDLREDLKDKYETNTYRTDDDDDDYKDPYADEGVAEKELYGMYEQDDDFEEE
jgi:DNA-directed RNA polymerase omega subunit